MSRCRQYRPIPGTHTVYHLMMRTHGGAHLFAPVEREHFVRMLHKVAAFSGVEVLNYCVLSNHYHLLVRVYTPNVGERVNIDTLLTRYRALYGESPCRGSGYPAISRLKELLFGKDTTLAEFWRLRLESRMNNVSLFMKTLNQRFTTWYNSTHQHFGTLWAERFKDVVVEDEACARGVLSAYLDLNPVRAGMVTDPQDYRWCGFAAAMAGQRVEQAGIIAVLGANDWKQAAQTYRRYIYFRGAGKKQGKGAIPPGIAIQVEEQEGTVSLAQQLRCRLCFLTRGAFLGSETFVKQLSSKRREYLKRVYRQHQPGAVGLATGHTLYALRHWKDPLVKEGNR